MEVLQYKRFQETLYREVLDNGLEVIVLPKSGFQKTYATFATKFGSIDNHFAVAGKEAVQVPDGIAHFLEHKMFEEPTGDIFATFASQGASANAFTAFDRTVYLFSATEQIEANLETLIDFVQNPHFTDENVEKEKGIIEQEINMYADNPDWRVYFGLIEALYQKHPVHIDIAGTAESIGKIDKETLYECYETFYHPSNMLLFVVGGVDAPSIIDLVKRNQAKKSFAPQGEITRIFEEEPAAVRDKKVVRKLAVSLPKCMIGFKEKQVTAAGIELLEQEAVTKLMLDVLLGSSTPLYQYLYEQQLITDSFGHEYNIMTGYGFSVIGGDTPEPERLLEQLRTEIQKAAHDGLDPQLFERVKRKKIGGFLRMLNSPEAIAGEFTRYSFRDSDIFDILAFYENSTLEQVNARLRDHFDFEHMAVSIVTNDKL